MAIKVGEAYVEIYPRINQAMRDKVVAQVAKDFRKAYQDAQKESAAADAERLKSSQQTDREVLRSRTDVERKTVASRRATDRESDRLANNEIARAKKSEGTFHKLATQFRTIGTVGRGLLIGTAVLSSWNLLQLSMQAVVAAGPLIAAGLTALPALFTGAAIEGLLLYKTIGGVGTAIKDAFNPQRQKQFQQEFAKLAPSAKQFVNEIRGLSKVKLPNLQQTFFSNPKVQQTGKNVVGFAKGTAPAANRLTAANAGALGSIGSVITGRTGIASFSALMDTMARSIKNFTPGLAHLVGGFLELNRHIAETSTGRVSQAFNKWLTDTGYKLGHLDVASIFHKGAIALHGFVLVGKDVASLFHGLFIALGGSSLGKQFFSAGGLGGIIHTISTFANSGVGQIFLKQLFNSLNELSKLASSLAGSTLKLLAGAFGALYPQIGPLAAILAKMGRDLVPLGPLIGKVLASAFTALTRILTAAEPLLRQVVTWMTSHPEQVLAMAKAVAALYLGFAAFNKLKGTFGGPGGLVASLKEMSPATLGVIAVLAALVVGVVYAYKHSQTFRNAVHDLWVTLQSLGKQLRPLVPLIKVWWSVVSKIALAFLIADVYALVYAFKGLMIAIAALKRAFDNMKHWILTGWNATKTFFVKTLPSWFASAAHQIAAWFAHILGDIHSWWSKTINFFTGTVKGFFVKTIPSWVGSMRNGVVHWFDDVFSRVKTLVGNIKNFFTSGLKNFFIKTVPSWIGLMAAGLRNGWKTILGDVTSSWVKVYNAIRDVVQTIIDRVWNGGLAKAWNALVGHIPGISSLQAPHITIPRWGKFAQGGHVRGAGNGTSDSIPAWLSNGEFIVNAQATSRHRALLEAINSNRHVGMGYAAGGPAYPYIEAFQRAVGPPLGVSSTTGGSHVPNSYHYRGMAVDFVGSPRAMDVAAANMMKFAGYILELIHSPSWFVHNGHPTGRSTYAAVYANHFNHMHLAMTKAAAIQALADLHSGKIKPSFGFGPGGLALDAVVAAIHKEGAAKYFAPATAALAGVHDPTYRGIAKQPITAAAAFVQKQVDMLVAQAQSVAASGFGAGTALKGLSGRIPGWIAQASKFANIPPNWVPGLEYIIAHESGGNPNAINRTDINARRGIPSQGLMQLIPPNFRNYHAAGTSNNILDPVANIAAAVNYIHGRYGTIFNTPWLKHTGTFYNMGGLVRSYDQGGILPPGLTMAYNGTGRNEYVSKGGDTTVHVYVDGVEVAHKSRIETNNQGIIRALDARGGHRP